MHSLWVPSSYESHKMFLKPGFQNDIKMLDGLMRYIFINTCHAEIILRDIEYMFAFSLISGHWFWDREIDWIFLWNKRTRSSCLDNTMAVDGLATLGDKASAIKILTLFYGNIPVSAADGVDQWMTHIFWQALMDRDRQEELPKLQVQWIDGVCRPLFKVCPLEYHFLERMKEYLRDDSRFASSQWNTALLCNDVSHWLGANLKSVLYSLSVNPREKAIVNIIIKLLFIRFMQWPLHQ